MSKVELRQVVGEFSVQGKVRRAAWNMDMVLLDGRQVATINRVPGAPIGLLSGAVLTPSEKEAVAVAVAKARGGVRPANIKEPVSLPYELLDDGDEGEVLETEDETDVDDESVD